MAPGEASECGFLLVRMRSGQHGYRVINDCLHLSFFSPVSPRLALCLIALLVLILAAGHPSEIAIRLSFFTMFYIILHCTLSLFHYTPGRLLFLTFIHQCDHLFYVSWRNLAGTRTCRSGSDGFQLLPRLMLCQMIHSSAD